MKSKSIFSLYIELIKPRILFFQFITVSMGFYMATFHHEIVKFHWIVLLLGTGFLSAGGAALNNVIEKDADLLMNRTKNRGLPQNKISILAATILGVACTVIGTLLLANINLLTGWVGFATVISYVLIYTPMKKISWLNTYIGAIPGALPPLGGWAAGANILSKEGWVLFLILFCWQIPHFFAIDWMYKDDYRKGGFKMLSSVDKSGILSSYNIIIFTLTLISVSLIPYLMGLLGRFYCIGVLIIGVWFFWKGIQFYRFRSHDSARGVLRASIIYLPIMILLFFLDHILI